MLWVALATLIMMLTGEIYDTRAIAKLFAALRESITDSVPDEAARAKALHAAAGFEQAFETHRLQLVAFAECIDRADHDYRATQSDYTACAERAQAERAALRRSLAALQIEYQASLSPEQHALVLRALRARPEARLLDPALAVEPASRARRRSRGIEGVATQRHLTLPRNVVSIVYGPLVPSTFGQRYPSRIIDAGTSYARDGDADAEWYTRVGIRIGLFDDVEASVVLPFQLAPEFDFDPALIVLSQQIRLDAVDVVLRLSFQSPGDTGWAFSPAAIVKLRGRWLAFQAGLLAPMEIGTVRSPRAPVGGFNVPLRLTWNVLPALFLIAESGLAYENLERSDGLAVPLGFGAGYTVLAGSRLFEITGSWSFDRWLVPEREAGEPSVDWSAFRVQLGASFYFKAL